jgi:glycine/D-amino acid oxidase-like deaminating enzyme
MHNTPAPLQADISCDVAIVGGGYTGLNAAKHLAENGIKVCVCEAGHIGWGASGRNGGFCANPSTKQSLEKIVKKYGAEDARAVYSVQREAIEQVRAFYTDSGLKTHTPQDNAELALAHSPYQLKEMRKENRLYKDVLGVDINMISKDELIELGANSPSFYGGCIMPWGFGLHPLNYLRALADTAINTGAIVSPHTEIIQIVKQDGKYILSSEHIEITAKKIIIATNGYTSETIPKWAKARVMPILSSILVTRPITKAEQERQGWTTHHMSYDTRTLLHYFRLLPDGRMMFGGRGASNTNPAYEKAFEPELRRQFLEIFPEWHNVETDYYWSGCIGLNTKKSQFIGPIDSDHSAWASLAYHGSGVAMASWSGKAIAQMVLGQKKPNDIPKLYSSPSPRFPFPALRPQYLKLAYAYYRYKDKR